MSSSSFLSRLDDLQQRLKAENKSVEDDRRNRNAETGSPSPRRPRMSLDLDSHRMGSLVNSPQKPMPTTNVTWVASGGSDCALPISTSSRSSSAPSSGRRRNMQFQFDGPHRNQSRLQPDSVEIDQKIEEIMKQSGILTLNGHKIRTDVTELESKGELGHGTCGQVVRMLHKPTGMMMAVKQMRRSGNSEENKRIIMDLDVVIKSHDCPYIVQCVGTFITKSEVWICMELMSTCLDKLLKRTCMPIPEKILGKMAVAIVKALHYLKERHGVIHRDVKPSNMLLDVNGTVKLCDFGISGRLVDSKAKTRSAGCAAYMAPERIDPPDPSRPDYDIRADVWSLGISLVELATGEFPYKNCRTDFEVLTKVLQEEPPQLSRDFCDDLRSFVKDCLTKDYKRRPKYKRLLEHQFIKRSEAEEVDTAAWFTDVSQLLEMPRNT